MDCKTKPSIGGMKSGMDHRIMPPYRIIKDEENIKVVGGDSENDTQLGGYPLNQRKGPSVNVMPSDGHPFHQKTGYDTIDISEVIPLQQGSTWDARRDKNDYSRLMN